MKIEDIKVEGNDARFVISGASVTFMNALRRTLMAEIPKMAIETVEFHMGSISDENGKSFESTGPLFDEILAHRLGLVPIPTDLSLYKFRKDCACGGEGCPTCTIMFSLNKKGPCVVYSGDLEPLGDSMLAPVDKLIPLTKLTEDEAILIYATAQLGRGRDHAKWQVTHGAGYRLYPTLKISKAKCEGAKDCVNACPRKVLAVKEGKAQVVNLEACNLCMACVEACEKKAITVEGDETKFIFQFETDGSLSARDALMYALEHLEGEFTALHDSIGEMME